MSFTATRTGTGAASRIRSGTSRSQRMIWAGSSDSASPARVGEKSFSRSSGGSPHAPASRRVVFELSRVERELPRGLADRVWEIDAEVAGREIDAVRLAHVRRKIARQLALEALEVALQSLPRPTGRTGRARTGDRGPCDRGRERQPARRQRARA